MNGQKYDWRMYEYEPVVEETTIDYFPAEEPTAAPLAAPIIVTPQEGVLSRPVGELIASARESIHDSVLGKPVGELLTSAVGDSVLGKPVGELLSSAVGDSVLAKPVGELLASAKESLGRTRRGGSVTALSSGTWA